MKKKKRTAKEISHTSYHEIRHCIMAEWLGYTVHEIRALKTPTDDCCYGFCVVSPAKSCIDEALIQSAPYVYDKDFTMENVNKFSAKHTDINQCIKYLSSLDQKQWDAHITIIKMVLDDGKDLLEEASAILKKKKLITYTEGKQLVERFGL